MSMCVRNRNVLVYLFVDHREVSVKNVYKLNLIRVKDVSMQGKYPNSHSLSDLIR